MSPRSPVEEGADYLTVFASSVTAVWASKRPFTVAPVFRTMAVLERTTPSRWEVVPKSAMPATCQNMFLGDAPPLRMIWTPELRTRLPAISKIQISFVPPERTTLVGAETLVLHLYTPGGEGFPADIARAEFSVFGRAARDIRVGRLHVIDGRGHVRRSGRIVIRRVHLTGN